MFYHCIDLPADSRAESPAFALPPGRLQVSSGADLIVNGCRVSSPYECKLGDTISIGAYTASRPLETVLSHVKLNGRVAYIFAVTTRVKAGGILVSSDISVRDSLRQVFPKSLEIVKEYTPVQITESQLTDIEGSFLASVDGKLTFVNETAFKSDLSSWYADVFYTATSRYLVSAIGRKVSVYDGENEVYSYRTDGLIFDVVTASEAGMSIILTATSVEALTYSYESNTFSRVALGIAASAIYTEDNYLYYADGLYLKRLHLKTLESAILSVLPSEASSVYVRGDVTVCACPEARTLLITKGSSIRRITVPNQPLHAVMDYDNIVYCTFIGSDGIYNSLDRKIRGEYPYGKLYFHGNTIYAASVEYATFSRKDPFKGHPTFPAAKAIVYTNPMLRRESIELSGKGTVPLYFSGLYNERISVNGEQISSGFLVSAGDVLEIEYQVTTPGLLYELPIVIGNTSFCLRSAISSQENAFKVYGSRLGYKLAEPLLIEDGLVTNPNTVFEYNVRYVGPLETMSVFTRDCQVISQVPGKVSNNEVFTVRATVKNLPGTFSKNSVILDGVEIEFYSMVHNGEINVVELPTVNLAPGTSTVIESPVEDAIAYTNNITVSHDNITVSGDNAQYVESDYYVIAYHGIFAIGVIKTVSAQYQPFSIDYRKTTYLEPYVAEAIAIIQQPSQIQLPGDVGLLVNGEVVKTTRGLADIILPSGVNHLSFCKRIYNNFDDIVIFRGTEIPLRIMMDFENWSPAVISSEKRFSSPGFSILNPVVYLEKDSRLEVQASLSLYKNLEPKTDSATLVVKLRKSCEVLETRARWASPGLIQLGVTYKETENDFEENDVERLKILSPGTESGISQGPYETRTNVSGRIEMPSAIKSPSTLIAGAPVIVEQKIDANESSDQYVAMKTIDYGFSVEAATQSKISRTFRYNSYHAVTPIDSTTAIYHHSEETRSDIEEQAASIRMVNRIDYINHDKPFIVDLRTDLYSVSPYDGEFVSIAIKPEVIAGSVAEEEISLTAMITAGRYLYSRAPTSDTVIIASADTSVVAALSPAVIAKTASILPKISSGVYRQGLSVISIESQDVRVNSIEFLIEGWDILTFGEEILYTMFDDFEADGYEYQQSDTVYLQSYRNQSCYGLWYGERTGRLSPVVLRTDLPEGGLPESGYMGGG